MDKLMKAYDYLPEAHEYTKGLNHYQKHALLIQLCREIDIAIESEEAIILLPVKDIMSYRDSKPFTLTCDLEDQETVCWQSKFAESPKLNINGNLKPGRKKQP
jgi:hypothetical protein